MEIIIILGGLLCAFFAGTYHPDGSDDKLGYVCSLVAIITFLIVGLPSLHSNLKIYKLVMELEPEEVEMIIQEATRRRKNEQ